MTYNPTEYMSYGVAPLKPIGLWTPELVAAADDPFKAFAEYVQQNLGTPWATNKDIMLLRKHTKELFANTPNATWFTLCRVVAWCKSRKKHPARVYTVITNHFREAFSAGALPELQPKTTDDDVEADIEKALEAERRPEWRRRLLGAIGREARAEAYGEWKTSLASL